MTRIAIERRRLLGAMLIALTGLPRAAGAVDAASVVAPIRQLCDALLAVMHAGRSVPFQQRFDQLAPVVESSFDLTTILQVSVGPGWAALPPDQQTMLRAAFRRYTVASYVNSFDEYNGQRFEISPQLRALPSGEQVVNTRIIPVAGDAHVLDYVMRQMGQGWRVVDVLLDGTISRVAVQRSDFRSLLQRGGATALAKSLQEKTANLSGSVG